MSDNFSDLVQDSARIEAHTRASSSRFNSEPNTLVLIFETKKIFFLLELSWLENVSMGTLYFKADHSMPEEYEPLP